MCFSLTGLKAYNGQLEFYNVDELETMATAEHFMATDIDWDPTGRQVLHSFCLLRASVLQKTYISTLTSGKLQISGILFSTNVSSSILCHYSISFDPLI
jgi:hypothetical protein